MKCRHCGTAISPDSMYCERCQKVVQIVPDYNPLDDVLAAQVKGSMGYSATIPQGDINDKFTAHRYTQDDAVGVQYKREQRRNTEPNYNNTGQLRKRDDRDRQRQAERKKERMRRRKQKRRVVIALMVFILASIIVGGILLYNNSYSGLVRSGENAYEKKEYNKAEAKFENAIKKKAKEIAAYNGLSDVYIASDNLEKAEEVYTKAIEQQTQNTSLYIGICEFYIKTKQVAKISPLIDSIESDNILTDVKKYTVKKPSFDLKEETYDDVQELNLASKGNIIYYTLDGAEPTIESIKYVEPIQIKEGANTVKAIAVNELGIPSLLAERNYLVEFPVESAPSVTPSTGRYSQPMKIKITVPEGYEAYYTLDGTEPTQESEKYMEPIDMPEGKNTIFSAILYNSKGKSTEVTKRNYELNLE